MVKRKSYAWRENTGWEDEEGLYMCVLESVILDRMDKRSLW